MDPAPWEATGAARIPTAFPPYPVDRVSDAGEAPGLKVPVAVALGMNLRSSRTQVATSMFICLARWNAFPGETGSVTLCDAPGPLASPRPQPTHSPCCLEKIFFCRRSRGILSMTGLWKVTWGEGSMGEHPHSPPGTLVEKPSGIQVCTPMFWGLQSLWHCIILRGYKANPSFGRATP